MNSTARRLANDEVRDHGAGRAPLPAGISARSEYRSFLQTLDLVPQGMAFFDLSAMLLCANRSLIEAVNRAADGDRLFDAVVRLAQAVAGEIRAKEVSDARVAEIVATREIETTEGTYRLRGSRVDVDLFGLGSTVLLTVDLPHDLQLPEELLVLRYRLTRTEVKVARLLAEGRSNKGIAAHLGISTHTARHHTQRVLQKLNVRSRAEVARRLHAS